MQGKSRMKEWIIPDALEPPAAKVIAFPPISDIHIQGMSARRRLVMDQYGLDKANCCPSCIAQSETKGGIVELDREPMCIKASDGVELGPLDGHARCGHSG